MDARSVNRYFLAPQKYSCRYALLSVAKKCCKACCRHGIGYWQNGRFSIGVLFLDGFPVVSANETLVANGYPLAVEEAFEKAWRAEKGRRS